MKNSSAGITLIEIIVVIFIIALFTIILITDFPKMLRQLALSRATYDLAQDLRKVQDLGLSGVQLMDVLNKPIAVKGYGIYIDITDNPTKYILYADVGGDGQFGTYDQKYNGDFGSTTKWCSKVNQTTESTGKLTDDCIVEIIDLSKKDKSLSIYGIGDSTISLGHTSINFLPPGPTTNIDGFVGKEIGITLKNTDGTTRSVKINTAGLISIDLEK